MNIIFVKTPSTSSSQQTEVILPEQDEHKNLVYVLLKKAEAANDIKIRRPQAKLPQKPGSKTEVTPYCLLRNCCLSIFDL